MKVAHLVKMTLISVVGCLGSGKTTFVRNLLKRLQMDGVCDAAEVAYVLNDEGEHLDGELSHELAQVIAMTNGCFTCSDDNALRTRLKELEKAGTKLVFLEGFGITSGSETRSFLDSSGYPFHVITTVDHKHHKQNLVRHSDLLASHIKAATLAVCVTKFDGSIFDLESGPRTISEIVSRGNSGILLTKIGDNLDIPEGILGAITGGNIQKTFLPAGHVHGPKCGCSNHSHGKNQLVFGINSELGHSHPHQHSHVHQDGVHGVYPYSVAINETATFNAVQQAFSGKHFVLRVKGATEGRLFNMVHGDWKQTSEDRRNFVTFYTEESITIEVDLPELTLLMKGNTEIPKEEVKEGYQMLRDETGITREETVSEIQRLIGEFPEEPVLIEGVDGLRLITHPEGPQILKEMSRRPSVKEEWFPIVIKRFMEYWIKCALVLRNQSDRISKLEIGINRLELGVSMTWWTNIFASKFGDEMVDSINSQNPGEFAIEGVLSLQSLNSDPEKAKWQCLEIIGAVRYHLLASQGNEVSKRKALEALSYSLQLAKDTPALLDQWQKEVEGVMGE